jgi:hypothetical protein
MLIPDPRSDFFQSRIPVPGVKKALDPGSGSATLKNVRKRFSRFSCFVVIGSSVLIQDPGSVKAKIVIPDPGRNTAC